MLDWTPGAKFCPSCGRDLATADSDLPRDPFQARQISDFKLTDMVDLKGRFNRFEYLLVGTVAAIVVALMVAMGKLIDVAIPPLEGLLTIGGYLAFLWVVLAATARRLNDTGQSAVLVLFAIVPGANIALFLFVLFWPGKVEGNKWAQTSK